MKEPSEFPSHSRQCNQCLREKDLIFRKSKDGWAHHVYKRQRRSSRERNHLFNAYTLVELKKWVFSQEIFHALHKEWTESGYDIKKTPSLDRLDDYKPYTLDNLRVVTWEVNDKRYHEDRKAGINNKTNIAVKQYSPSGELIQEFHSHAHAERMTGLNMKTIADCSQGKIETAFGYIWKR